MKVKLTLLLILGLGWGTVQANSLESQKILLNSLEMQVLQFKKAGQPIPADLYREIRGLYGLEDIIIPEQQNRVGGEDIATAVSIPGLPYSDTGNTCGFVDDYDEVCPYTGSTSPDVVYAYTPAGNETVTISLCTGSTYDTKLFVYENLGTPGSPFACNDDACPGYVSELAGLSLTAGNTYYIVVDGYGGDCGDYTIDFTTPPPPPPGDACVVPFVFPALPATEYGTTTDNSNTYGNSSADEWWELTIPADGTYLISLCGSSYDTYLRLLADCSTEIASNDDECGLQSELSLDLATGSYIVCVEGYSSSTGDYILDISRNYERHVPADYANIQDAIDASYPGDTIVLDGGRNPYREQLYITHSLNIQGSGIGNTILEMPDVIDQTSFDITTWTGSVKTVFAVIGVNTAGTVNIDGLTIDGRQEAAASMYGVYYYDTDGAMTDCRVTNITHPAQPGNQNVVSYCAVHSDGGSFDVTLSGNELPNMQKCGLLFMGPEGNCVVSGNDIDDTVSDDIAGNGMQISYGCTGTVTDNEVSGLYYSGTDWGSTGILLFECGDVAVSGGQVYQCEMGVNHSQWNWVYTPVAAPTVDVTDVTVEECDWGVGTHLGSSGVQLALNVSDCFIINGAYSSVDLWGSDVDPWGGGYYNGWTGGTLNAEIHGNYMSNGDGIVEMVTLTGNSVNVNAANNSFASVGDYGVYNDYTNTINAENNWWGDPAGPTLVTLADYNQLQRRLPSPVLAGEIGVPAGVIISEQMASNQRTGVNVSPFVDFDPWFLTDGYQLDQSADVDHISVEDPGVQTPEHDPLQYQSVVTYELVMATPTENWRSTTAFIAYDPLVLEPVAVTKIYDPPGSSDQLMSNLMNDPDGMLEITWYLTGITNGVQGGETLFSVTFDGLTEDVNPGTVVHIDQVVMRNPGNVPITAGGGSDININVDDTAPTTFTVTPPGNPNINANPTFVIDAVDNVDLHRVMFEIVGYGWDSVMGPDIAGPTWSDSWILDVSGIPDGDYTVNFRCWDDVGYYTDGAGWAFHLDRVVPTPPADLTAAPRCGLIHLDWTAATGHDSYELWREKRVPYPYFYDYGMGTGGLPPESVTFSTMIPLVAGATSYDDDWGVDESISRGVYDYKLIAIDSINPSAESGVASSTNYYLGDWYLPYDCNVGAPDLAGLSIYYGTISLATVSDELDVAPTSNWGRFGLPGPDGLVNFEDLIVMAMNYRATGPPIPFSSCWPLPAKEQPQIDEGLVVTLNDQEEQCELVVNGTLFAMSIELATTRQLLSARANDMLVLTYATADGWMVDLAAMGELRSAETVVQLQFQSETEPGELRLVAVDARGAENNSLPVTIQAAGTIPAEFSLAQNYPNPFNPSTTINYDLAAEARVTLELFNLRGQLVTRLVDEMQPAGSYQIDFNAGHLASGIYYYRITAGEFTAIRKMALVK
ncbi:MAG: T9SS type A sorting domain-containing protein [Candidatus Delongbacteria bacterium]|nr:T9SS type A sorting domain-containing protein [Candidatus Delongbacteria bacterium]